MKNEAFLCYINAKDYFFNNVDFNFDNRYLFHVEVDKSQLYYRYTLHISKRKGIIQPKGFWSNNISNMNVITGRNGAGKTSILKFIINNIGRGTTAMNGEGVIYIVNEENTYIVFHNCRELQIEKSIAAQSVDILLEEEYFERMRALGKYTPPFDNRRFWKNIIFFSNYFGATGTLRDDGYVINVSKDREIGDIISNIKELSDLQTITIQDVYQKYRNLKTLHYVKEGLFELDNLKSIISLPNLLRFKLTYVLDDYGEFYRKEKDRFPNQKWVGKRRYPFFLSGLILKKESEFEFEAAINKFSVDLMWYLLNTQSIRQEVFDSFINELAETEEETGIVIAKKTLQSCIGIGKWIEILEYLEDDSKQCILYWQSSNEFVYRWSIEEIEFVEKLITSNEEYTFFSCDLVGSETNGYYSSGEESRMRFCLSLFDALEKMNKANKETDDDNRNIILVLDEVDAYFHPKYQIELINNLVEIVSAILKDYYVQVILTSNTPIELSDFPASNIIYLEKGEISYLHNEVQSFGSNVCNLLKNNFYINSTMGTFAKNKIDKIIKFLVGEDDITVSKEEVKYIISIIGEPLIKNKLQEMYYKKFPEEMPSHQEKLELYKRKVHELQQQLKFEKNIDLNVLEQLEKELISLADTIKGIKG